MLGIIIALVLVGVALYIISLIPMDPTIKKIITVLVIVFVCLYALQVLGLFAFPALRVP